MKVRVTLDRDFAIGEIDPRLYGGFAEHLGRHIYGGFYEPGHPRADAQGFRTDVLELVRELSMPVMRYPGGNFVSGYNWEDGVGPRESRPRRLDLAWKTTETNQFGTDEFIDWCRLAGTEPMLAVNLGTRGPDEARNLLEYCNHPGGTAWSDLRRKNGHPEPHGVKLWCLGNEMDGPWQMGFKTPTEYGRIACETAKLMKWTDPGIELVACGSSGRGMKTFGEWELEVLDHAFEHVDYISLHTYIGKGEMDTPGFLARPDEMDAFIEETVALCDAAAAKRKSSKRIMLSFDEWNVWYHSHSAAKPEPWAEAPALIEDGYTMEDALVFAGMLISLINHADRVKIGCLAQVVNVIAPIIAEPGGPAWRQTIFHPFRLASTMGRGTAMRAAVECPRYDTPGREGVPSVKVAAVREGESGALALFVLNRSEGEVAEASVELRGFGEMRFGEGWMIRHDDLAITNSSRAENVQPLAIEAEVAGGAAAAKLPPLSWSVLRLLPM